VTLSVTALGDANVSDAIGYRSGIWGSRLGYSAHLTLLESANGKGGSGSLSICP